MTTSVQAEPKTAVRLYRSEGIGVGKRIGIIKRGGYYFIVNGYITTLSDNAADDRKRMRGRAIP